MGFVCSDALPKQEHINTDKQKKTANRTPDKYFKKQNQSSLGMRFFCAPPVKIH